MILNDNSAITESNEESGVSKPDLTKSGTHDLVLTGNKWWTVCNF